MGGLSRCSFPPERKQHGVSASGTVRGKIQNAGEAPWVAGPLASPRPSPACSLRSLTPREPAHTATNPARAGPPVALATLRGRGRGLRSGSGGRSPRAPSLRALPLGALAARPGPGTRGCRRLPCVGRNENYFRVPAPVPPRARSFLLATSLKTPGQARARSPGRTLLSMINCRVPGVRCPHRWARLCAGQGRAGGTRGPASLRGLPS